MEYEVQETKPVWLVISNTDLTEGRGYQRITHICVSMETAIRVGKKGYIMGSDCPIEEAVGFKINNKWYYPGVEILESSEDSKNRLKRVKLEEVLKKAVTLGLSEEEIKTLKGV